MANPIQYVKDLIKKTGITPADFVKPQPVKSFMVKKVNGAINSAIPKIQNYFSINTPRVVDTVKTNLGNFQKGKVWKTISNTPQVGLNVVNSVNKWLELDRPVINKTGNPYTDAGIALVDPNLRNIRGAFNLFNLPSYALGGIIKESKSQLTGQTPTGYIHPALSGSIKGVANKEALFEQAPSALGVDPNSLPGMAIGLTVELASPDLGDIRLVGKSKKITEEVTQNLSKLKNIADNSDSVTSFIKNLGKSDEAFKTIRDAGFNSVSDYWEHAHEGFNKLNKLLGESLAQTKYRQKQSALNKSVDFVKDMTNEVRRVSVKSMTPKQQVGLLDYFRTPDKVLEKIGLGNEAKALRQSWDNYLVQLPKEIEKVTQWSNRVTRPQGNQLIFKYLDGQVNSNVLLPDELKVASEIKSYLRDWAVKLKLPEDSRLTNYITHIWDNEAKGVEFPEEIASLIRDKVAGSVYDPFVSKRMGQRGYVEDTWKALDAYVKRATRKVNMDEVLDQVKYKAENLDDKSYTYIKSYIDRVNLRPTTIDVLIDDLIKKSSIGNRFGSRPVTNLARNTRQMVYRGLLGLNPVSALKNLSQGANTYAELGEKYFIKGYTKMISDLPNYIKGVDTELERVGVLRDSLIQDRTLSATKKFWEKADKGLFYLFELAEKINRGGAYYGAKARALAIGKSEQEAIEIGKELVRKTQFTFGNIDTPIVLQGDMAKTIGQFQSYSLKQAEYLVGKVQAKEWAGLVRYVGSSLLFIYTIGKALGMDWKDLIPSVRIGVPPTLQAPYGAYEVATGKPDKYSNPADPNIINRILENKNLTKGTISYVPGGNFISKSLRGVGSFIQGKSTTPSGRTRFEVEQSPSNLFKSALFGQYATPEGQEYVKNLGKSKGQITYEKYKSLKKRDPEKARNNMLIIQQQDPDLYKSILRVRLDEEMKATSKERSLRSLPVKDRVNFIVKNLKKYPAGSQKRQDLMKRYYQLGVLTDNVYKKLYSMKQQGLLE